MRRGIRVLVAKAFMLAGVASSAWATRSIVACDAETGSCGIASVSRGSVPGYVPFGAPGVIVAEQALGFYPSTRTIINLVLSGSSVVDALNAGVDVSWWPEWNQFAVAALDPESPSGVSVATFAGQAVRENTVWCEVLGDTFAVVAARQTSSQVCAAMGDAFVATPGRLARRLLTALLAGTSVGIDSRGEYSASVVLYSEFSADALLTPVESPANIIRSKRWASDVTWELVATMFMDTPADPRDEIPLTRPLIHDLQRILKALGTYESPANGRWNEPFEEALVECGVNNSFYPRSGTVVHGEERFIDAVYADYLLMGFERDLIESTPPMSASDVGANPGPGGLQGVPLLGGSHAPRRSSRR